MPLKPSKSREAFSSNVKTEMAAGKPQKQAVAIAYSEKRRTAKMHSGGMPHGADMPKHYAQGGEVKLNLNTAKKVSEDAHSSTFKLGSGHVLRVAHAALSPAHRDTIKRMPLHMAEAGEVPASLAANPSEDGSQPSPPDLSVPNSIPDWEGSTNAVQPKAPPASATPPDMSQARNDVQGGPGSQFAQGFKGAEQAIKEQQGVEQQQAAANAAVLNRAADAQQDLMNTAQVNRAEFEREHQSFMKDAAAGHIDPNHYMQSLSDTGKVATAIGLFLGGFSAPFTHQGNPALSFLNDQINRDVAAQRANLEQKNTLLNANRAHFQDEVMADNATRAQLLGLTSLKLQKAAAALGTPAAKARADQATAALQMQQGQLLDQNALRAAALQQSNSPSGASSSDPSTLVPILVPEANQKEVFNEIKNAQGARNNGDEIMRQFDIAANHQKFTGQGRGALDTMKAMALPLIHDAEGRVNEYEANTLENLMPSTLDGEARLAAKRQGLVDFINQKKAAPTARGYGINLDKFQSTQAVDRNEGRTGTLPNGQRVKVVNGRPVPIK